MGYFNDVKKLRNLYKHLFLEILWERKKR